MAAPIASLATLAVVGAGVLTSTPSSPDLLQADLGFAASDLGDRAPLVSRSAERREKKAGQELTEQAQESATEMAAHLEGEATDDAVRRAKHVRTKLWTTTVLDIWSAPGSDAELLGELEADKLVLVTGRKEAGRVELVLKGVSRWVTEGYLSDEKPVGPAAGISMAPCPNPGVESGLTTNAIRVYRSVCHAFPQITSYGGWDNHGEHSSGRALDIMTSDVALGTAIADYLRAHAAELHLYDVIWRQHIWTPVRAGEGWRLMPSRGSATANHYDHVHVSTY